MLGLPFVTALACGLLVIVPLAWFAGIATMFVVSIAGLRRPSAEQFHAYGRLALLGVAWMAALAIYAALAIID
jgi:hypothetical protein